ncbi:MAG: DUF2852 domain-containing protein [Parvibaculaceae bacterium]
MTSTQSRHGRWTPLSILAVVAGFIVWWPLGLSALAYVLWAGPIDGLADDGARRLREAFGARTAARKATDKGSGNAAFDAYRAETLKRLEAEQAAFAGYLDRLREARDREEFERFMAERKQQQS